MPDAPADGAEPLGFNLEGPFLAAARRGAHDPRHLLVPADVAARRRSSRSSTGSALLTVAPELPGALGPHRLARATVAWRPRSGHSAATLEEARAGYAAGATSTTHLFNAMTGVDHRAPGRRASRPCSTTPSTSSSSPTASTSIPRCGRSSRASSRPTGCCSSATRIALAGTGDGRGWIGSLDIEVVGRPRRPWPGTTTLAGSVLALDTAVRNLVGVGRPAARPRSRPPAATRSRCSASRTAAGSRSASGPISSSSTPTSRSAA